MRAGVKSNYWDVKRTVARRFGKRDCENSRAQNLELHFSITLVEPREYVRGGVEFPTCRQVKLRRDGGGNTRCEWQPPGIIMTLEAGARKGAVGSDDRHYAVPGKFGTRLSNTHCSTSCLGLVRVLLSESPGRREVDAPAGVTVTQELKTQNGI